MAARVLMGAFDTALAPTLSDPEATADDRECVALVGSRASKKTWRDCSISAAALQAKVFPAVNTILDGILTEGLTILAGRPKLGKSWLVLDWCLGVSSGEPVMGGINPSCSGDVLYLALEDNERRLQKRCTKLKGAFKGRWPQRLTLVTEWSRVDKGGLQDIEAWIKEAAAPKLIVIDTLQKVRPIKANAGYAEDYSALETLQALAGKRNVAVVILHHTRKMEADDPLDAVSGTLGLVGSADTTLVLDRNSQGVTLYGRGRDIETLERAMEFDTATCRWRMLGDAAEVRMSDTRKRISDALPKSGDPVTVADIADETGLHSNTVKQRLRGMVTDGEAKKVSRGRYAHPEWLRPAAEAVTDRGA
jgi:hypothetical protein